MKHLINYLFWKTLEITLKTISSMLEKTPPKTCEYCSSKNTVAVNTRHHQYHVCCDCSRRLS